jgi:DNA (cytosine-5)-methyltransferase 1
MFNASTIPVIDLFAGPGGLGEGFTQLVDLRGRRAYRIALSIEMDQFAHRTLQLRSFFRQFAPGEAPDSYYRYLRGEEGVRSQEELFELHKAEGDAAKSEAWCATLGKTPASEVSARIKTALRGLPTSHPWVMIGGPPCQAYSLVGRARMLGDRGHQAFYEDARHTLYREYLRLIKAHAPTVFIMENVKGLLSSRLNESLIFNQILKDLRRPKTGLDYRLAALSIAEAGLFDDPRLSGPAEPEQFLVHSEAYGIPQTRHRLIIVGIRRDVAGASGLPPPLARAPQMVPCRKVIDDLPSLRSGLSKEADSPDTWLSAVQRATSAKWIDQLFRSGMTDVAACAIDAANRAVVPRAGTGGRFLARPSAPRYRPEWFGDARLEGVCNHESRSHIATDLWRYLFVASFGKIRGTSPKIRDFPRALLPDHANIQEAVNSRMFNDRFRVQLWDKPATTITAHISKDGHYFIHPDASQVRSLTVREAARIQTFPDNYFFEGPRTEQYRQVGNAVPPLLARQIAASVAQFLDRSIAVETASPFKTAHST